LLQCIDDHADDCAMQYVAFLHSACVHGVKEVTAECDSHSQKALHLYRWYMAC